MKRQSFRQRQPPNFNEEKKKRKQKLEYEMIRNRKIKFS
jgi:hypothetical protein